MKLLAHRGLWQRAEERNSPKAFEAAVAAGFGIETDVRDAGGRLVISHDPPRGEELLFEDFLRLGEVADHPLAINIKADGLATLVADALAAVKPRDAFVFDMSIPDMRAHLAKTTPTFTRLSDLEPEPILLGACAGVWLDAFGSDWWQAETVKDLFRKGKRVAVVSPELHGRPPEAAWLRLQGLAKDPRLLVCTDFPGRLQASMR